jgi:hypothetical protein
VQELSSASRDSIDQLLAQLYGLAHFPGSAQCSILRGRQILTHCGAGEMRVILGYIAIQEVLNGGCIDRVAQVTDAE